MHKILVIRFSSLGDLVLTTPIYKNLKNSWPDCHITVAVKEKYAGIMKGNPSIDQLLILKSGESILSFIQRVQKEKFTILIDLHNNLRSNLVSLFSGAQKIIRYKKAFWARRLFVKSRLKNPELEHHTVHRYLETLKYLEIEPQFFSPEIFPEEPSASSPSSQPFRLLIVQTAYLGDAILTTPIFEAIRQIFPSSKISVLCTPEIKEIFTDNKNIDEILVMDKRGKERGFFSLLQWGKRLRDRFDVAILPHRSFRSACLVWLAKIPKRIGFNNSQGKIFLTDLVSFEWSQYDAKRNLKLLEVLGIKNVQPEMQVPFSSANFQFEKFLSDYGISSKTILIGMNPGSVWKTKRWLPERFAEVADRLIQEWNGKILLLGSTQDSESVKSVIQSMKLKDSAINLCGKTDLKSLSFLVSRCSLFITNDSGPMHLACAVNVPVVAIFGPTTRELGFFPYGEKSSVVEVDLSCRPCTLHGGEKCPLTHFNCMRHITTEMVLSPCRNFLSLNSI